MPILDKIGQEIAPGKFIAYGHALGRCAGIRLGKVLGVSSKPSWREGDFEYRITVRGVDDDWDSKKPAVLSKRSTLYFPSRMIVLDRAQVPSPIVDLLDAADD